jgi:hypothetical protein
MGDGTSTIILTDQNNWQQGNNALFSWSITDGALNGIEGPEFTLSPISTLPDSRLFLPKWASYEIDGTHDYRVLAFDFDNAGLIDVLIFSRAVQRDPVTREIYWADFYEIQFLKNEGGGSFIDVTDEILIGYSTSTSANYNPQLEDINGDGLIDIVLGATGWGDTIGAQVLIQTTEGKFKVSYVAELKDFFDQSLALEKLIHPNASGGANPIQYIRGPNDEMYLATAISYEEGGVQVKAIYLSYLGLATQGQTLTASNTLADVDGLGSISYQWQADGIDIASATSNTFKLGATQVGKAITVVASYTDQLGAPETKISSASSRVVADASLPTLASSVPADNASSVYPTSNLVLSFSEAVGAGSGNIVLTNLANGSDTRTIAVTDTAQVSFSGTDLSINPSANLLPGASYAISMASGVVVDYANNPYTGISGNTALDFTVASTVNLSGHVYAWKSHTLIDGVSVTPSTGSAASSSGGLFNLSNLVVGDYTFAASRTATSDSAGSAITSADALAALKIAVGINPNSDPDGSGSRVAATLSPYQLMAADVTGDGRVTSADALAILKMAVNLSTAVTPTWIFADESQIFNLSSSNVNYSTAISKTLGADQTLNLVAVLKGDVNGSWGTSAAATTHVDYSNPTYFATLANSLQVTQDVWGIS